MGGGDSRLVRVVITRGTLADGRVAAVLRYDLRTRDEGSRVWQRWAVVWVCTLDGAPACTSDGLPNGACPMGRCRARLVAGVLTLATAHGRQTWRIVAGDAWLLSVAPAAVLATATVTGVGARRIVNAAPDVDVEVLHEVSHARGASVDGELVRVDGLADVRLTPGFWVHPGRRRPIAITTGTLGDGEVAAVIRVDTETRDSSSQPWRPAARVAVCTLGVRPRCTRAVKRRCGTGGCRATLAGGILTLISSRGIERHRIDTGRARDAALLHPVAPRPWHLDATARVGGRRIEARNRLVGDVEQELVEVRHRRRMMEIDPGLRVGPLAAAAKPHERRDRVTLIAGSLAPGRAGVVVELAYRRRKRPGVPWQRHAQIVACAVRRSPRCTRPLDVACPAHGCRARLAAGVLTVTTLRGAQTHRVVAAAAASP